MTSYKETIEVKSFAFILRESRLKLLLTQEQLAEKLDVSTRMIASYEAGSNLPRIDKLIYFAKILQVSVDTLLASLVVY